MNACNPHVLKLWIIWCGILIFKERFYELKHVFQAYMILWWNPYLTYVFLSIYYLEVGFELPEVNYGLMHCIMKSMQVFEGFLDSKVVMTMLCCEGHGH